MRTLKYTQCPVCNRDIVIPKSVKQILDRQPEFISNDVIYCRTGRRQYNGIRYKSEIYAAHRSCVLKSDEANQ